MQSDANLRTERPTFVTHLECSATGEIYEADKPHNLSKAGKPLLVRYDLPAVRSALTKELLAQRPNDIWRWRELLPSGAARILSALVSPTHRSFLCRARRRDLAAGKFS